MILLLLLSVADSRALGDRALVDGDYATAARHYAEAEAQLAPGANPGMRADLAFKRAHVARLGKWRRAEHGAWLVLAAILSYFVIQSVRAREPLAAPLELWYVAPVYALFIAGALGRDPAILATLLYGCAGSLLLIAVAGRGARRGLDAALLVAGNLALFFAAANRAGLFVTFE